METTRLGPVANTGLLWVAITSVFDREFSQFYALGKSVGEFEDTLNRILTNIPLLTVALSELIYLYFESGIHLHQL